MKRWIYRIVAGLLLAGFILLGQALFLGDNAGNGARGSGQDAALPAAWQSMETAEVMITAAGADKTSGPRYLSVRIADEPAERAQGMQHLPARVVRDHPIWFVFERPQRTGWHMRNVRIALDIIYVDEAGTVISIERMEPEGSGYGINAPIAAALEVAAGQAERLGITPGSRIVWTRSGVDSNPVSK